LIPSSITAGARPSGGFSVTTPSLKGEVGTRAVFAGPWMSCKMGAMDPVVGPLGSRLDALVARFLVDGRVPGIAAGVVHDGTLAWAVTLGLADRASRRPVLPDTLFRIASLTKAFTATAVLQLRDEGRLRLDDPLAAHLPEAAAIRNPFGPIEELTLRRLLTHTSGLQGEAPWTDPWQRTWLALDDLVARLDQAFVRAPPGSRWQYCNLGYDLLAAVVGRVAGESFEAYLQHAILDVAGLGSTVFTPSGELAARVATGYGPRRHDDDTAPSDPSDSATFLGSGGLWSTLEDLARWIVVQCRIEDGDRRGVGNRVLDGPTLREMHRPMVLADEGFSYGQGYGWASIRIGETPWVSHTGSLDGFRAMALFRPTDGLGVVALANGSTRPGNLAREIATAVFDAGRAAPPAVPSSPPTPVPEPWRELLGAYQEDEYGFTVRVEAADGALVLVDADDPAGAASLVPASDPLAFTVRDGDMAGERCVFLRGSSGTIAGLNISGMPLYRLGRVPR
jgi:CubicO group peptidase (beta-lactamase class C family)